MSNHRQETWARTRTTQDHFKPHELEYIERSFREGIRAFLVAEHLRCSIRVIHHRYCELRGGARLRIVKPIAERRRRCKPKPRAPLPDRFYHSTFEL
jgi:hypothetical protein